MTERVTSNDENSRTSFQGDDHHWVIRTGLHLAERWRPYLGWAVLGLCLGLAIMPALVLNANRWIELRQGNTGMELVGAIAVLLTWLVLGWRSPFGLPKAEGEGRHGRLISGGRVLLQVVLLIILGFVVVTQLLASWLPNPFDIIGAIRTTSVPGLFSQMLIDLNNLFARYALWWQGVQAGGAVQDNLVFAGMAGLLLWILGCSTAWLTRATQRGLIGALPVLWISSLLLLYSGRERFLLILVLALSIVLHLLLDQQAMSRRWKRAGVDFSPDVMVDRLLAVMGAMLLILTLAAVFPSISVSAVSLRYYEFIGPFNDRMEDLGEQLFPELRGSRRHAGSGVAGGLPNEFLLSAGPDLGSAEVMRVRTNETQYYEYVDQPPPQGHYMRGATFVEYDGHGWQNPTDLISTRYEADQPWVDPASQNRKPLVQSIFMTINSPVLYAAPEPVAPGIDYRVEVRTDGDMVAMWGRQRTYTIISAVPFVNDEMLETVPAWDPLTDLPPAYMAHLALPDTITERTRQLAMELTAGLSTPHAKASAIEAFLRTYEYDLSVPEPPADVDDVADFFLFDLQRGYCDYYATAFVVLARLAGLPARFSTGYAVGRWDGYEGLWIVTEAEAHSWPEVYFPQYGWIQFEPTAGRPQLARIGSPASSGALTRPILPDVEPVNPPGIEWNWQMLFWLLPVALLGWALFALVNNWRTRRQDPWQALVRWGRRSGRPMAEGETMLEYGDGLAEYVAAHQTSEQDMGRVAARELLTLSRLVTVVRYGPEAVRSQAAERARDQWLRLRGYLRRVRIR